ncbi:MAG: alanine racemase [Candidatus Krumholzibacteriia bacterium]
MASASTESPRPDAPGGGEGWLRIAVERAALRHNAALFRALAPPPARLLAVVKADGYGHGIDIAARAFLDGGADLLGVHAVAEARALRAAGVGAPILILGPLPGPGVALARQLGCEITIGSLAGLEAAVAIAGSSGDAALPVHLKVETGVNRQGIVEGELAAALARLAGAPGLRLTGLSSHFADIEDTTDHGFASAQMARFEAWRAALAAHGHGDLQHHMSCSAAAILWPASHRTLVRVGVSAYGIWPSRESRVSARGAGRGELALRPALTWTCGVSQVRTVPAGETVGYGRSWKAPVASRIAVLPVGYADGWPRALSNRAHVLLRGARAPLRGRVCMNLCMADVTHIPDVAAGDRAVLLGRQGEESISAELLAEWLGTIPYEVLTLPGSTWERTAV